MDRPAGCGSEQQASSSESETSSMRRLAAQHKRFDGWRNRIDNTCGGSCGTAGSMSCVSGLFAIVYCIHKPVEAVSYEPQIWRSSWSIASRSIAMWSTG